MRRPHTLACAALLSASAVACAQESTFTPAATQPSVGRFITKHLLTFDRYEGDRDTGGSDVALTTTVSYGITRDLSASLILPVVVRRTDAPNDSTIHDLADLRLEAKYRFWQHDPGPVDTLRLAVRAGLELPTGSDGLSSEGVDPYVGITFMSILGKHGFNQSLTT